MKPLIYKTTDNSMLVCPYCEKSMKNDIFNQDDSYDDEELTQCNHCNKYFITQNSENGIVCSANCEANGINHELVPIDEDDETEGYECAVCCKFVSYEEKI